MSNPGADRTSSEAGMLHLHKVVPFVPDRYIRIADPDTQWGIADREIRLFTRFLGPDRIPTAGTSTALDMLVHAGQGALSGTDISQVRFLIHAHTVHHISPPDLHLMDSL